MTNWQMAENESNCLCLGNSGRQCKIFSHIDDQEGAIPDPGRESQLAGNIHH